jgi:pimeloyl-ACP methyl ester carboxylesterase
MSQNTTVAPPRGTPPRLPPARPRRWRRRLVAALVTVVALLAGAVLYGAYGYLPAEAGRGYQPHYTRTVPSRFADTPVARFHYLHAGSGSPVILLSPGAAWVVGWRDQLPVLARDHSVYVVDLPGQGYTQLHDRHFGWNLAAMTRAIGTFMDAVGVRRAALAGNSWTGGLALAFAQRHPERVSRLALLERGLHWSETQRALPATRTPTLVLWGRQDKIVPVWQAERLGRLLPDARVRVLDGCGHGVQLDCPEQVNPVLADFLRDSRGP